MFGMDLSQDSERGEEQEKEHWYDEEWNDQWEEFEQYINGPELFSKFPLLCPYECSTTTYDFIHSAGLYPADNFYLQAYESINISRYVKQLSEHHVISSLKV